MSASATIRSITEPFAGNRRHNIQSVQISFSSKTIISHELESDIDGLEQTIKIEELRLSSLLRNTLLDMIILKYPEGLYLIEFKDLRLPKELSSTPELQGLTKKLEPEELYLSGAVTVLVLPNKLLRLERINHLQTNNEAIVLGQEPQRSLIRKINLYLPKTIF